MASITSLGAGSGLDLAGLVDKLVAAEGQSKTFRLDRQEFSLQAKLSAIGSIKGALSAFQTSASALTSSANYSKRSISFSNPTDVFKATASSDATPGTYSIEVQNLAKSHSLATAAGVFNDVTDAVGEGTLTIKLGTTVYDPGDPAVPTPESYTSFTENPEKSSLSITIDSSNNTLQGVVDEINSADAGVTAAIINDGSGQRLAITSDATGLENSLEITVDEGGPVIDNTDNVGLSRLAFNSVATNIEQGIAAEDSISVINGITVNSDKNSLTDTLQGITIDLLKAETGSTTSITIVQDKASVKSSISAMVDGFNALVDSIKSLSQVDEETGTRSVLTGDAMLRNIENNIRRLTSDSIDGLTGSLRSLVDIGITTGSDGKMVVDSSKLDDAINDNFDEVVSLFADVGTPTDSFINFTGSTSDTTVGTYAVNITTLATQGSINGSTTAALADDGAGNFTSAFVVDSDNDSFFIKVDGVTSGVITLTQGAYTTTASLVSEIQSKINNETTLEGGNIVVNVSFDATNDRFIITSDSYGSDSSVVFTAGDANTAAELGFDPVLAGTDGVDVAGTIGGIAAQGVGQTLSGLGSVSGLSIDVLGTTTGSRGEIGFTRGLATGLDELLENYLGVDNLLDGRTQGINSQVEDIEDQRESLSLRLQVFEARLLRQFSALDSLVSSLNQTSSFLTQQLSNISAISNFRTNNN